MGAAGASGPKTQSLSYFNVHPCALITQKQAATIFGQPMGAGQSSPSSYGGSCSYSTTGTDATANVNYGFKPGSIAEVKSEHAFHGALTKEKSLGHNAICNSDSVFVDVGSAGGSAYNLSIAAGTCAYGVAFAKDALAHLK
jgi:hypothetical protein